MKTFSLPPGTDTLLVIADDVAWELEDKRVELGIDCDEEALLHASKAAAEHRINRYLTLAADGAKSAEARMFLEAAKVKCDRSIEQLHRRITRSLAQLCRIMDAEHLTSVAQHVIAVGA
jgi:hypothetical protein